VALHCDVASVAREEGSQVTATEVIEIIGGVDCTVTVAVPDFVASCVLVAVTVMVPAEAGAVKSPLESMVPVLADQVTVEL
jgi:hypothetical protein